MIGERVISNHLCPKGPGQKKDKSEPPKNKWSIIDELERQDEQESEDEDAPNPGRGVGPQQQKKDDTDNLIEIEPDINSRPRH